MTISHNHTPVYDVYHIIFHHLHGDLQIIVARLPTYLLWGKYAVNYFALSIYLYI